MIHTVKELTNKGLISPPKFVQSNCCYQVIGGSVAYGCNIEGGSSDVDLLGFCIPEKEMVFPHLSGEIIGFGQQKKKFDQYQQHHVFSKDDLGGNGRIYDITIFSIVKFFQLAMENNPNVLELLFVPQQCVIHTTQIGNMVRERRKDFLHKGIYHKMKGYSFAEKHKMLSKNPEIGSKRSEIREKYGWDLKHGYNVVRLLGECEQILIEHDLDLQRNKEMLKAIRRGEVPQEKVLEIFDQKEKYLEELYQKSTLRYGPDEPLIKQLLVDCLEHHYGNLSNVIKLEDRFEVAIKQIKEIVEKI